LKGEAVLDYLTMKTFHRLTLIVFVLATSVLQADESRFPGAAWEHKSPAELGLDAARLDAVAVALGGRGCVVKDGYVVKAWGDQAQKGDWLSSAKPVLSTLLLFAVQEGKVRSVDTPIAEFGWELSPKDRGITFRHLANMTSGYARPEEPGTAWAYNDYAIQLYQKTLFDRVYEDDPDAVANANVRLGALGLEDGLSFTADKRRLKASARDFARIAWFWLNRGRWQEHQVLPARYFDDHMRPQTPTELPVSATAETNDYLRIGTYGGGSEHFTRFGAGIYGFNWWFNGTGKLHPTERTWPGAPVDTVMSIGAGGNCSVLLPSLNLIVVCAQGDWGRLEAGVDDSVLNQRLTLIARSGATASPHASPTTASPPIREVKANSATAATVSGELKQWHRVTLDFRGPPSSEVATPNPFRDYRLNVTFTNGDQRVVVPGHFGADGSAAETGASEGDHWRVYFTPPLSGLWKWTASFRTGPDIATNDDGAAGQPVAFDGASGQVTIATSDKTGRDFRGQGTLRYVGQRYLQFAGTKTWFLKGGADSPENFLAYDEFDDTKPTHRYAPHALDFRAGDPMWRGGKGRNILGALNYLASVGVNSVYMLTMNVQGDGKDVWPWISDTERLRYDVSKLDQWEIVFAHMDRLGIMQHFVLQEQENDQLLDGGELGLERRIYFRELISRFAHHPAITWNLGEENTNTLEQQQAFSRFFHQHDPYRHPVVIHTFPRQIEAVYSSMLGFPDLDGASLQTNQTHQQTKQWIARSSAAGRPWVVSLDEIGPANTGVKPDHDDFNHDEVRVEHLWGHLLAGGAGVEWLFGYKFAHNDINLEDFRSRDQMWRQTRIAVDFFQQYLAFTEMQEADEYAQPAGTFCFARPGHAYVLQWRSSENELRVWLPEARYSVAWFNPRRGGQLETGSIATIDGGDTVGRRGFAAIGHPPQELDRDWIALLRLVGDPPKTVPPPPQSAR